MRSEAEIRELRDAMRVVVSAALSGPNADRTQAIIAQTVIESLDWVCGKKVDHIDNFYRHIAKARKRRNKHETN